MRTSPDAAFSVMLWHWVRVGSTNSDSGVPQSSEGMGFQPAVRGKNANMKSETDRFTMANIALEEQDAVREAARLVLGADVSLRKLASGLM